MDINGFWGIINDVHQRSGDSMDAKCELLRERLRLLSAEDLQSFIQHFDSVEVMAYTWELWAAAYIMNGGCSDDAFSDFRATLISMGRATYEAALNDPESLADVKFGDDGPCYEGFQYVKNEVAEEKLGSIPPRTVPFPHNPTGMEWKEDEVDSLYPKLAAKYSSGSPDTEHPSNQSRKPWWKFW